MSTMFNDDVDFMIQWKFCFQNTWFFIKIGSGRVPGTTPGDPKKRKLSRWWSVCWRSAAEVLSRVGLEGFWARFGLSFSTLLDTFWELKSKRFFYRFWGRFGCPFGCLLGSKMARFVSPGGHRRRKGDTCKKLVLLKENHAFWGLGGPGAHTNWAQNWFGEQLWK